MSQLISAYAIYNGASGVYYGDNPQLISLNCLDFQAFSPKFGYLKRQLSMGVAGGTIIQYSPTFDANDPEIDSNTLQGVFVQQGAGLVMIDAVSAESVVNTCDACCDAGSNAVTRYYTSGVPAFVSPTTSTYTIARADNGTPAAIDQFSMDYMSQTVTDPIHSSYASGTSYYIITAFGIPYLVGTDTLV